MLLPFWLHLLRLTTMLMLVTITTTITLDMPRLPLSLLLTSPSKFQASNTETLSLEQKTTSFRLPRPPICLLRLRPSDSPPQTCRTELSTLRPSVTRINLISKKTLAILTTTKDRFRITLRLLKEPPTDLTHLRKVMTT